MTIPADLYTHGKLLLTGEYLVMKGARALALPLKRGQRLHIDTADEGMIRWKAQTPAGPWFEAQFEGPDLNLISTDNPELALKLQEILKVALSERLFAEKQGYSFRSMLEFLPGHGFGSSSTLMTMLAQWTEQDPYQLHHHLFGGSGFDVACANADGPLVYSLVDNKPHLTPVRFRPPFHEQLYFVYLGRKQRSTAEIERFKRVSRFTDEDIHQITQLTNEVVVHKRLEDFEHALTAHEQLMSRILERPMVKDLYFKGWDGVVKSLGAWGGDFVMVTSHVSHQDTLRRLASLGFDLVYTYADLVL